MHYTKLGSLYIRNHFQIVAHLLIFNVRVVNLVFVQATGSSWYEDFMYCKCCYDLRQKGNFCPLCLQCYHDSDFTTKVTHIYIHVGAQY